ncbi:MAG: aldehyde dehydrogenase family protein, partial [Candidatus Dadabacteria bacterium]
MGQAGKVTSIKVKGKSLADAAKERTTVAKTYKLYIGGKFVRSESGRHMRCVDSAGSFLANVCRASRKDLRDAVKAAREAQGAWSARSAYNRAQILYRLAEMLEGRSAQFIGEMVEFGFEQDEAERAVRASVDRLVYYAGWADKYQQVFATVNPVSSPHFNFSYLEPVGVVAAFANLSPSLLSCVTSVAPIICGGNAAVIILGGDDQRVGLTFAEVAHSSDVPAGVINILSGDATELLPWVASHMDINSVVCYGLDNGALAELKREGSINLKRVVSLEIRDLY